MHGYIPTIGLEIELMFYNMYNLITYFFHFTAYDVRVSQYNYMNKCIALCCISVLQLIFLFGRG